MSYSSFDLLMDLLDDLKESKNLKDLMKTKETFNKQKMLLNPEYKTIFLHSYNFHVKRIIQKITTTDKQGREKPLECMNLNCDLCDYDYGFFGCKIRKIWKQEERL